MAEDEERRKNPPPPQPPAHLPDLTPNQYLVAFIDILGFGAEIEAAKTEWDFKRIYKKLHFVQKAFENPKALNEPEEQNKTNADYGRKVLALSDAVVLAITPNCPVQPLMGGYDLLGLALLDIVIAQTRCACQGIFLRGGISHGAFFYDEPKDILLSPALARAYEIESKYADYPIIVVPDSTRRAICNTPKKGFYAPGADPTPEYFAKHDREWKSNGDEPLFFLDYAHVMVNEEHQGWDTKDKQKYQLACEKHDHKRAQKLIERKAMKNAAFFLKWHRHYIEAGYKKSNEECVRRKYRWLLDYHNRAFNHDLPYLRQQVIDMSKYHAPKNKEAQTKKALKVWPQVEPTLHVPHNEREYRQLVKLLDRLVDDVGENENHPLASLMEVISVLIEKYEDENVEELA